VDFCSGNFPIPMYLTLRTDAKILGIEIQQPSCDLAKRSIEENKLEEQIDIMCENVIGIHNKLGVDCCDLVLCNPPFFKLNENSNLNIREEVTIARHEVLINLEDIIKEASIILRQGGYFTMVHRPERLAEIFILLKKYQLEPSRLQFVYPKANKEANHILIEARKGVNKTPNLKILPPLIIYDENNQWTNDILKIYNYSKEE
jgi:tRNA1(Val) A37 N6-methylase TrmN6